jgi:hypothetical protein
MLGQQLRQALSGIVAISKALRAGVGSHRGLTMRSLKKIEISFE